MREIDYKNINHRKVKGLFYVKNINKCDGKYEQDNSSFSIVMTPDNQILKPAFDYICSLDEKSKGINFIDSCSISISHFYNFLLLYDLTGEEHLTNYMIDSYIKFLANIPKGLYKIPGFNSIHPSDIDYIPVHPYIEGITNKSTINSIYMEWYKKLGNNNALHMVNSNSIRIELDEESWRYSFEFIAKTVRKTLDYLEWLSADYYWSKRFAPLSSEIVSKTFIKTEKISIEVWDIAGRIAKQTNLKRKDNSIIKKRVFTEYEIERIFSNDIVENSTQKKLLFTILLYTGMRVSEVLNLLLIEDIVELKGKGSNKYYVIKWEELLTRDPHMNIVADNQIDILIDTELEFYIRIKKRKSYESSKRKNKKNQTRYIRLRDTFDIINLLNIKGFESMFVNQNDFYRIFNNELLLHTEELNIKDFLEPVITYFKDMKSRGISIEDKRFDSQHRTWLFMIRELIEKSYFGSMLRDYLINRYELKKASYFRKQEDEHFLFISERPYQKFLNPLEPYIVNNWLKNIFEKCIIERYDGVLNRFTKHNIKRTLSVHTFRHTYITYRIGYETLSGVFNHASLAQLKKEVGHVLDSEVTLSRYYFLDQKRRTRANTSIYNFLTEHMKIDDHGGE